MTRALRVDVPRPVKTPERYEFRCEVSGNPPSLRSVTRRVLSVVRRSVRRRALRHGPGHFGFRATNFEITHSDLWDSVFPLMYLTRNGGPLYRTEFDTAVVRVRYPLEATIADFFVRRAAHFGLNITLEADLVTRQFDWPTSGRVQPFGGGKDSRALYGLLSELGQAPRLSTSGAAHRPPDLRDVQLSEPIGGSLTEKIMPSLMSGAAHFYFGGSLNDSHWRDPWQQYYDMASPEGHQQLTALFRSVGVDLTLHGPLILLPANVIQHLLATRYPDLAVHQVSTTAGRANEKNLHISLAKLHHGLPFEWHCPAPLFRRLLRQFVSEKTARPDEFGYHGNREVFHREMMAILARHRDDPRLSDVAARIPHSWGGTWIDAVHLYVHPKVEPDALAIFRTVAVDYEPGPGDFVVATPPVQSNP